LEIGTQAAIAPSLNEIIQYEIPPLLRRQHLNRDIIIGLVGDRGDGKSLGGGIIALIDFMLQGEPCWSNMQIGASFDVDDGTANRYGFPQGGVVNFYSEPLDMEKFLRFDESYHGGLFFIDEINIAIADARRAMSNQNLQSDDVGQMLRKLECGLIYTCIHEMFVDVRIRDMTDIFIKTSDTALSPEGLNRRQRQGLEFEWIIYPMSRKLTGRRYADEGKTLDPVYIKGQPFWGAINSLEMQRRRKYSVAVGQGGSMEMEFQESQRVLEARSRWGWLYEKIQKLHADGVPDVLDKTLWEYLELDKRGIKAISVGKQLAQMGITKRQWRAGTFKYVIDTFDLKKCQGLDKMDAVLTEG